MKIPGFYCIDNLPLGMLPELVDTMINTQLRALRPGGGCHRRAQRDRQLGPTLTRSCVRSKHELQNSRYLFLTCDTSRLLKRFSETRRKHPAVAQTGLPLADAIQQEKKLLEEYPRQLPI